MNTVESLTLTRYVRAACPQQAFDEFTPDAWHDLLADLRFVDCKDAARNITMRQPFCAPSEIRAEVARIRRDRIASAEHRFIPPPDCEDYIGWLRGMRRMAADGELTEAALSLTERDMALIEAAFREPPKPRYLPEQHHIRAMRQGVIGNGPRVTDLGPTPEERREASRQEARDAIDGAEDVAE